MTVNGQSVVAADLTAPVETVSTTADTTPIIMWAATLFFTRSISFAPKCCEVITEQPAESPMKNPSAKKLSELVEPTAASLISPSV